MVTVDSHKENFVVDETSDDSLREERRRTGRYVATVIAIFVSLFGLYQAMARGTPEYAAFFLPALIMFLYVLWILYASRTRSKTSTEAAEITEEPEGNKTEVEASSVEATVAIPKPSTSQNKNYFHRSYSVA